MPIRKGDGTSITPKLTDNGISEVRKGDGTVLYSAVPPSGVFRWDCQNGNNDTTVVEDIWGNGYDGTVTDASYNSNGGNDGNGAYESDCDVEVSVSGVSGPVSFAGWFFPTWAQGSSNRIVWNFNDNGRELGVHYNNANNSGGYEVLIDNTSVVSNVSTTRTWLLITVTYDGSGFGKIYINGTRENDSSGLTDPADTGSLSISQAVNEGKDNDLRMAEFIQYDKELSDTEVSNLFNTGSIGG